MRFQNLPIAKEGIPFFSFSFLISLISIVFGNLYFAVIFFVPTVFIIWFFRNPKRSIPVEEDGILAPADGRIVSIQKLYDKKFLERESILISIFMSIFNVHVNRVPQSGKVTKIEYNSGKFISANKDKASLENEQNAVIIDVGGKHIVVNQIAGMIARRIVCYVKEGDRLQKGQRFGLIKFGSRVDIYLPLDFDLKVRLGDKVKGGETILGYLYRAS